MASLFEAPAGPLLPDRQERQAADADAARRAMGDQRWADPDEDDGQEQR